MRRRYIQKLINNWDELKSPSVPAVIAPPTSLKDFDYTMASAIATLKDTVLFPYNPDNYTTYQIGMTESLLNISGQLDAWSSHSIDISAYQGATARIVFKYQNGSGIYGDLQMDNISVSGATYSFENVGESFQTSVSMETDYSTVVWDDLLVGTTTARWNVDTGGTPSSNTGRTDASNGSYYVYAETSSPANVLGATFWLRSPEILLTGSNITFDEARLGANIGTLDVYLDIIN